jgi:O-antigen/teichoic acid export membrane protein
MSGSGSAGANLWDAMLINVATMAMNVAASVICARMLGPAGRGALSVVLLWPILATGVGTLGLPRAVTFYLAKDRQDASLVTTGAFALGLASILSAAVLYCALPKLAASQPPSVIAYTRWSLVLLPLLYLGNLPYYALQGLHRLRTWNAIRVQFSVLWLAMHVAGYLLRRTDLGFYVWGYILVTVVHNLTWLAVFVVQFPAFGAIRIDRAQDLLKYGLPLTLGSLPQSLNLRLDQVLMAALVPPRFLGLYVIAVAWSGITTPALTAFSQVLFPILLAIDDPHRQFTMLARSARLTAMCAAACGVVLIISAPVAIPLIYGRAFAEAALAACILSAGSVFLAVNNVLSEGFRAVGLTKHPMYAELTGFAATGVLLVMLLPRWHLVGASIASVISYAVTAAVLISSATRSRAAPPRTFIVPEASDFGVLRRLIREGRLTIRPVRTEKCISC